MKKYVTLGEICKLNMGQSPDSSTYNDNGFGIPFYQGNADFGDIHPVTAHWCTSPTKIAEDGDILISVRAPIGALNIATERCCIGRGLAAITVDSKIASKDYIWHMLKSRVTMLQAMGTGSTFKAINKNVLNDMRFLLPTLEEQGEIALNLSKMDEIIRICTNLMNRLDLLVKSRFVEMFGEPILNPKGWDMATIGDIVTEVKYGTSRPAVDGGKYAYLRMNNLTYDGHLDLTDLKRIDIPDNEIEKCIVRKGDVLFNRTNSVELVGKTCVFNESEDMVIAGYIIRVRLKSVMLPIVLSSFMNTDALKKKLRTMAKGAVNQANINAQELQAINIYLPPIDLQQQFATFVEQTDKSKFIAINIKKIIRRVRLNDQF